MLTVAEATYQQYNDMTKKKTTSLLSDILKRSSTCAGGDKYTYTKVGDLVKRKSANVYTSDEEQEQHSDGSSQRAGGSKYSFDEVSDTGNRPTLNTSDEEAVMDQHTTASSEEHDEQ